MEGFPILTASDGPFPWTDPEKKINDSRDVRWFQQSKALANIKQSLLAICELVRSEKVPMGFLDDSLVSFEKSASEPLNGGVEEPSNLVVRQVLRLLDWVETTITHHPPLNVPKRFGNPAFRTWHDDMSSSSQEKLLEFFGSHYKLDDNVDGFVLELNHYFVGSFGSRQRMDYGTGHELSFFAFFTGLILTQTLPTITGKEVLMVFSRYYDIMKRLVLRYTLEPAGSHGVWGLDDHFHIVYILGAAELTGEKSIQKEVSFEELPKQVLDVRCLKKYRTENLYFNAISFIRKVKTGPFNEHSPILYDIAFVKTWDKILEGMIKMYLAEVLSKFPVVQHFHFGSVLFPWVNQEGDSLPFTDPVEDHQDNEAKLRELLDKKRHVGTKAPWAKR